MSGGPAGIGIPTVIREAHFMIERLKLFASKAKKRPKRELAQDATVVIEKLIDYSKTEYNRGYERGKADGVQSCYRLPGVR